MLLARLAIGLLYLSATSTVFSQPPKADDQPPGAGKNADATDENAASPDKSAAAKQDADKSEKAPPEQLQQWIKDLVHQKFATRQAASQKLIQAGVPGMQAAADAAKTEDLELATRCMAVLTEGLASKSEPVQKAARAALEELTKSDNISVAQRAKQALETPMDLRPGGRLPGFQVQQVRMQIKNGVRELTVVENGKESVITDNNGKDITITVTETANGQKKTQTFKAKDVEELKKNHPEAHAMYSRFAGGKVGRIQIGGNVFGGNIFAPVQPQLPRRARVVNPFKAAQLFEEVDKLREELEKLNQRLRKSAEADKPDTAELKRIADELQATTKRLGEIKVESQVP